MCDSGEVLARLRAQVEAKKKAYKELNAKYKEITGKVQRGGSVSPLPNTRSQLDALQRQILVLAAEEKALKAKIYGFSLNREEELNERIEKLELKLAAVSKDNQRLNAVRNPQLPPLVKIIDSEECLMIELKSYKKSISSIEQNIQALESKASADKSRLVELEQKYSLLKVKAGEIKDSPKTQQTELVKRLEILTKSWKSNVLKLENIIKVKEQELKSFSKFNTEINSKIFKQSQQLRLLEMSKSEYSHMKKDGIFLSDTPDIYHPDVSFLYKPSVKALYST